MKKEFVATANHQRFETAIKLRSKRAASESGLVVVHGRAGEGKTRTLHNWASANRGVMITAYPGMTPTRALREIAAKLKVVTTGDWQGVIDQRIAFEQLPLVVDEAGFALADGAATLERLRTITDKGSTMLVMAVMQSDMSRLRQYEQITSRATLCEFLPSTVDDIAATCAQLSDVRMDADLVKRIHHESEGRMRLVLDAIAVVEAVALADNRSAMALADMKGMRLCQDFDAALSAGQRSARQRQRGA